MKLSLRFQVVLMVLLLLPAASVFAGTDNHKGSLNLGAAVQAAGKDLPAGDYTVKWEGMGPTTQVNIIQDGKVVATVPARVIKLDQKSNQDVAGVKTDSDGSRTLTMIQFEGKSYALEIPASGGGDSASGSSVK